MIIVSSLVVHTVTHLHQDTVSVISLLDNVPRDVNPYRIPQVRLGTLETDVTFISVSKHFKILINKLYVVYIYNRLQL